MQNDSNSWQCQVSTQLWSIYFFNCMNMKLVWHLTQQAVPYSVRKMRPFGRSLWCLKNEAVPYGVRKMRPFLIVSEKWGRSDGTGGISGPQAHTAFSHRARVRGSKSRISKNPVPARRKFVCVRSGLRSVLRPFLIVADKPIENRLFWLDLYLTHSLPVKKRHPNFFFQTQWNLRERLLLFTFIYQEVVCFRVAQLIKRWTWVSRLPCRAPLFCWSEWVDYVSLRH